MARPAARVSRFSSASAPFLSRTAAANVTPGS